MTPRNAWRLRAIRDKLQTSVLDCTAPNGEEFYFVVKYEDCRIPIPSSYLKEQVSWKIGILNKEIEEAEREAVSG